MNLPTLNMLNPLSAFRHLHRKGLAATKIGILGACFPLMLATLPTAANAGAIGTEIWGKHCLFDICIPGGNLVHIIYGDGLYIKKQDAGFQAYSNICNWRITFRYYDVRGDKYKSYRGPINYNCRLAGGRVIYPQQKMKPGKACAVLFSNDRKIATQCHNITP
jgi:hypothetical protein